MGCTRRRRPSELPACGDDARASSAQWYRLSDPELEEALADRLSFRRFVGLSLQDRVPDETTLCRFRGMLAGAWPIG
ncbi:MAG: transposase [Acetobacteraceae bacterium]